jgi:Ca2+-binding EF-hand superfamily protein
MNFYNYLVGVVEDLKKTWEESRPYVEPEVEKEVELTAEAKKLRKDVIDFYDRQIAGAITKDDLKEATRKMDLSWTIPNAAWNKMAMGGSHAHMNTLWFIAFWNGDLDQLLMD